MAASMKQMKIIVPVMGEYATLVHPSIPSTMPTANTAKVTALLVFIAISSPPNVWFRVYTHSTNLST